MVFRVLFLLIHLKRDISLFHLYRFGSFSFSFASIFSLLKVEKQVFVLERGVHVLVAGEHKIFSHF